MCVHRTDLETKQVVRIQVFLGVTKRRKSRHTASHPRRPEPSTTTLWESPISHKQSVLTRNTIFTHQSELICSWLVRCDPFISFIPIYWNETRGEIYHPLTLPANIFICSRVAARKHQRTSLFKDMTLRVHFASCIWCVIAGNLRSSWVFECSLQRLLQPVTLLPLLSLILTSLGTEKYGRQVANCDQKTFHWRRNQLLGNCTTYYIENGLTLQIWINTFFIVGEHKIFNHNVSKAQLHLKTRTIVSPDTY